MKTALLLLFSILYSFAGLAKARYQSSCPGHEVPNEFLLHRAHQNNQNVFSIKSLTHFSANTLGKSLGPKTEILHLVAHSPEELSLAIDQTNSYLVEANCYLSQMALPNDPTWQENIGLAAAELPAAWDILHDSSVLVAIPDSGVDIHHEDLASNIWVNQKEFAGSAGLDDDGNGFVDDIYGWGFPENNNDVTPGTYSDAGHGTHVAGIIGAVGNNNLGTSGVTWKTQMMVLRVFSKSSNTVTTADTIGAISYAIQNGARVINASWGAQQTPTAAEQLVYQQAEDAGVFVVAAAGNQTLDANEFSPAAISTVFTVGSLSNEKTLSTFSNFGTAVKLLAPGGDAAMGFGIGNDEYIYSTLPQNTYGSLRGTSASAPFVSGVASLIMTLLPKIRPSEVRRILQQSADPVSFRSNGVDYSYGLLNAKNALSMAYTASLTQPDCSENCTLSFPASPPAAQQPFGGGGCQMRGLGILKAASFANSGASSPWDLSLLLSFIAPLLIRTKRALRKKKQ